MKKRICCFIYLLLFHGASYGFDENIKSILSDSEVEQIAEVLPKNLFEALGGRNFNQKLKEITLSQPLGQFAEKTVCTIFFSLDEYDFSTKELREEIDQEARTLLTSKGTAVTISIVPKERQGQESVLIGFIKGSLFCVGVIDSEGTDFVFGGDHMLEYLGTEKFRTKMEAASKDVLGPLLNSL